jgi:hypothetical protein
MAEQDFTIERLCQGVLTEGLLQSNLDRTGQLVPKKLVSFLRSESALQVRRQVRSGNIGWRQKLCNIRRCMEWGLEIVWVRRSRRGKKDWQAGGQVKVTGGRLSSMQDVLAIQGAGKRWSPVCEAAAG